MVCYLTWEIIQEIAATSYVLLMITQQEVLPLKLTFTTEVWLKNKSKDRITFASCSSTADRSTFAMRFRLQVPQNLSGIPPDGLGVTGCILLGFFCNSIHFNSIRLKWDPAPSAAGSHLKVLNLIFSEKTFYNMF